MKFLVTGGAGFIGSCFIKYILNKYNYKIINLDILNYASNLENLKDCENNPNYCFIKGDISDYDLTLKITSDCDCIVNFAAQTHVDNSIINPTLFFDTNINGVINLAQVALKNNIQKFIQISTDEVYGQNLSIENFNENSPLKPNNPYSASKSSADLILRSYYKTYNLPVIITRSSNNYGEFQHKEKFIPKIIINLAENKKIPIYGNGLNTRDWIYVYDHIRALDVVLHKGKIGEIYNISAHQEISNIELVRNIIKKLNKDESLIEFVPDRLAHDKRYAITNDKVKALGWHAQTNFNRGLDYVIEYYLSKY